MILELCGFWLALETGHIAGANNVDEMLPT